MSKSIKNIEEFEKILQNAGNALVCVDFTAKWCGPCKTIGPEFEKLATQNTDSSKVIFLKVDVDEASDVAEAAGVQAMPTFAFYRAQKPVHAFTGADTKRLQNDFKRLMITSDETMQVKLRSKL